MNREQPEKYLYDQSSHYGKYGIANASFVDLKVGVALNHGVSLCFVSLLAF